jgi:tetratricopeptide (TPR) repeat protein
LDKVNNKLIEIEKERELNRRYDAKITIADSLLIAKEYGNSLTAFKEATVIKPTETYPGKQIRYIERELINKAYADSLTRENEKIKKYNLAIITADLALAERRYADAIKSYNEALAIKPGNESLKRGHKIATDQLEKEKQLKIKEDSLAKVTSQPVKSKKKSAKKEEKTSVERGNKNEVKTTSEKEIKSYTSEELKSKYPDIDFASLPPQQPFNKDASNTFEMQEALKQVLSEKSRLDISDTEQSVKLICEGIFFENRSSTLRFLIQNNSQTDFLTGAMMLTWFRKVGTKVKLYPTHITPSFLPVINLEVRQ